MLQTVVPPEARGLVRLLSQASHATGYLNPCCGCCCCRVNLACLHIPAGLDLTPTDGGLGCVSPTMAAFHGPLHISVPAYPVCWQPLGLIQRTSMPLNCACNACALNSGSSLCSQQLHLPVHRCRRCPSAVHAMFVHLTVDPAYAHSGCPAHDCLHRHARIAEQQHTHNMQRCP